MCDVIVINGGKKEVETPNQFNQVFGCYPTLYPDAPESAIIDFETGECCLCESDVEASLNGLKIPFKREYEGKYGDYYVQIDLDVC